MRRTHAHAQRRGGRAGAAPRPSDNEAASAHPLALARQALGNQVVQRRLADGTLAPALLLTEPPALGNRATGRLLRAGQPLARGIQRQGEPSADKEARRKQFERQLLHSHWGSSEERRRFIRAFLRDYLAPAGGGEPDSDLLFMYQQHYENMVRSHNGEEKQGAAGDMGRSGPLSMDEIAANAAKMEEARKEALKREKERYPGLLGRIKQLGDATESEGKVAGMLGGDGKEHKAFAASLAEFRKALQARLDRVPAGEPLPPDLDLVMKSLALWGDDPGNIWGEDDFFEFFTDHKDLVMSSYQYATVAKTQNKCSAFVAETVYQSVGVVHKVYQSKEEAGKHFPYRAADWGNTGKPIAHFEIVQQPQMGDIWSNGSHVGIFLGEYAGKKIYVSARDDGSGVFGLMSEAQHEEGIQIKFMPDGGVFRRYTP